MQQARSNLNDYDLITIGVNDDRAWHRSTRAEAALGGLPHPPDPP
ncbi:MAG: hypothetical protein ACO331_10500 [Prochlorothrix sp.]